MITNFTNYSKKSNFKLSDVINPLMKNLKVLIGVCVPVLQKDISATYDYIEYLTIDRRNKTIPKAIGQIMTLIELPIILNKTPVFSEELTPVHILDVPKYTEAEQFPSIENFPKLETLDNKYLESYASIFSNNVDYNINNIPYNLVKYSSIEFSKIRSLILKSNQSPYEYSNVHLASDYSTYISNTYNVFSTEAINHFPSNMSVSLEYNDITLFRAMTNSIRLIQHKLSTIDPEVISNVTNAEKIIDFIGNLDDSNVKINSSTYDKLKLLSTIDHKHIESVYVSMNKFTTEEYKYLCNMYGLVELYKCINPDRLNIQSLSINDVKSLTNAINTQYDNTDWGIYFPQKIKTAYSDMNLLNLKELEKIVTNKFDLNLPASLDLDLSLLNSISDIISTMNSLNIHAKSLTSLANIVILDQLDFNLSIISEKLNRLYTNRELLKSEMDFNHFNTEIFDNLPELISELSNLIQLLSTSGNAVNNTDILDAINSLDSLVSKPIIDLNTLSKGIPSYNPVRLIIIMNYLEALLGYKKHINSCYEEIPNILKIIDAYNNNIMEYIDLKNADKFVATSAINILQNIETIPTFDKLYSIYSDAESIEDYNGDNNVIIPDVNLEKFEIVEIVNILYSGYLTKANILQNAISKYNITIPQDIHDLTDALTQYKLLAKNNRDLLLLNAINDVKVSIELYIQSLTIEPIVLKEIDLKEILASKKLLNNIKTDVTKYTETEFLDYIQFCGTYRSIYISMSTWLNTLPVEYNSQIGFHSSNSTEIIEISDLNSLLQINYEFENIIKPLNISLQNYNSYNSYIFTTIQKFITNKILTNDGKTLKFNSESLPIDSINTLISDTQDYKPIMVRSRLYKMLHANYNDMLNDFSAFLDYIRYYVDLDIPQIEGEFAKYNIIVNLNDFSHITNSKYTDPIIDTQTYSDLISINKSVHGHVLKLAPALTDIASKQSVSRDSTTISEKGTGKDILNTNDTIPTELYATNNPIEPLIEFTAPPLNIGLPIMYGIEDLTRIPSAHVVNKKEPTVATDSFNSAPAASFTKFNINTFSKDKRSPLIGKHAINPTQSFIVAWNNGTNYVLKNVSKTYIVESMSLGVSKLKYLGVSEIIPQGQEYFVHNSGFCDIDNNNVCTIISNGTFIDIDGNPFEVDVKDICEYVSNGICKVTIRDYIEVFQYSDDFEAIKYVRMNGSSIGLFGSIHPGPNHYKLGGYSMMINQYNQLTGFAKQDLTTNATWYKFKNTESTEFLKVVEEMNYPVPLYYGFDGEAQGQKIYRYTANGLVGYLIVARYYYNSRAMYLQSEYIQSTNESNQSLANSSEASNKKRTPWIPETVDNISVPAGSNYPIVDTDEFPRFRDDSAYGVRISSSIRSLKLMNGNTIIANRVDSFSHELPEYFFAIKSEVNESNWVLITPHMLAHDDPLKVSILSTYSAYDMTQFENHVNVVANNFGMHYSELDLYPITASFAGIGQFYSINKPTTLTDTLNSYTGVISDKTFNTLINYEGKTIGIVHPNGYDYILLADLSKIYDVKVTTELYNIYYTK